MGGPIAFLRVFPYLSGAQLVALVQVMSRVFRPPTFPLLCNIWTAGLDAGLPPNPPPTLSLVPCALVVPRVVAWLTATSPQPVIASIRLPKGTDVRPPHTLGVGGDVVECPAGSGRFYGVRLVDDAHKGFPNEYRVAYCFQLTNQLISWPFPIP